MQCLPSKVAYDAAADSPLATCYAKQTSKALAEAGLKCTPVCRPQLHKGTAAWASADYAHGAEASAVQGPHLPLKLKGSLIALEPSSERQLLEAEAMRRLWQSPRQWIMTPQAILPWNDASLRPCMSYNKINASPQELRARLNPRRHPGNGFLQQQQDLTSLVPCLFDSSCLMP